jgi:HEPN domain-containing protein
MNNNAFEGQRWLAQARYDLQAADLNRREGFPEIACFLAQQSAEKALKAFLYTQGERPVIGHATHRLVQTCAGYDAPFGDLLDACRQLDQYYIPTRYPNGIPEGIPHDVYTPAQAAQAVQLAQSVVDFISERLAMGPFQE